LAAGLADLPAAALLVLAGAAFVVFFAVAMVVLWIEWIASDHSLVIGEVA
jgi:hypothetical protein